VIKKIHHVAIAVNNLEDALRFYRDTLGLSVHKIAIQEDQGVKAALVIIGDAEIELLEPLSPDTPVGKFLERRGEGLHHVTFQTDNVDKELTDLKAKGVEFIDQQPRQGLAGRICFIHPRSTKGVLVELAQPPE
jgi:methylmalonyl-CoA/ethylmalonyl-CoA epimerase